MQETITGSQLIGYTESATGNTTFTSTDPRTGSEHPWVFHEASESEVDRAMDLAATAFEQYRNVPMTGRADFLRAIATRLEAKREDIVKIYCSETGLPEGRAGGELGRTQGQLILFADLLEEGTWVEARIDPALPGRSPLPRPDIRKCLLPMGPVAVFGASNFPLAFSTAGGDTASALAAGCPVVVKGHPLHPATGELVGRCIAHAAKAQGIPEGTFSFLHGTSHRVGERLVLHPETAAVGFTGSRAGGLALSQLSAKRDTPIPVFAEMGSINPVVLLPSALEAQAGWAKAYAGSVTLGTGQFCTNPGLLIGIEGPGLEDFKKDLAQAMAEGSRGCMLDREIALNFRKKKDLLLEQPGVEGIPPFSQPDGLNTVAATVAGVPAADFIGNPTLQEEVFGPFTLVVGCQNEDEMKATVACLEGQLTGSVLGAPRELKEAHGLIDALRERVGRLLFNGVPTGVEVCPAMHHGGPYPATTDSRFTAVGTDAIRRWVRPVSFQDCPEELLPEPLRDANPGKILRWVDGKPSRESVKRSASQD